MLIIKVNGREEKLSIGCRTFVYLDVLLKILKADVGQVTLNGETINSHLFGTTPVNGGDTLLMNS
jgi:hypothetical protein